MGCDCDCHKVKDKSDLKKCQEQSKRKTKELNQLKKKLLVTTIVIAVGGTILGKEAVDRVLDYFKTYDKVKQTIDGLGTNTGDSFEILPPVYYGSSPSPSTISVLALSAMIPTPRRR